MVARPGNHRLWFFFASITYRYLKVALPVLSFLFYIDAICVSLESFLCSSWYCGIKIQKHHTGTITKKTNLLQQDLISIFRARIQVEINWNNTTNFTQGRHWILYLHPVFAFLMALLWLSSTKKKGANLSVEGKFVSSNKKSWTNNTAVLSEGCMLGKIYPVGLKRWSFKFLKGTQVVQFSLQLEWLITWNAFQLVETFCNITSGHSWDRHGLFWCRITRIHQQNYQWLGLLPGGRQNWARRPCRGLIRHKFQMCF